MVFTQSIYSKSFFSESLDLTGIDFSFMHGIVSVTYSFLLPKLNPITKIVPKNTKEKNK